MDKATRFNSRAFVALTMLLSGFGLPVTGVACHIQHEYHFEPLTAARAWMAAHNGLGALFLIFSIWHIVLNRKVLGGHMRRLVAGIPTISREMILAGAVVTGVLLVCVGHVFIVR
jgi:cytochrome b subunit of formate dehydrogenase